MSLTSTTGFFPDIIAISFTGGGGMTYVSALILGVRVYGKTVSGGGRAFGGNLGVNISKRGFMTSERLS